MQLGFGVLCDQVRREDNGKLLFVGVYTADIKVPHFPIDLVFTLVLSFTPDRLGKETIDVTVLCNGEKQRTGRSELNAVSTVRSFAAFANIPVRLEGPGQLEFLVESGGQSLKAWIGDVAA